MIDIIDSSDTLPVHGLLYYSTLHILLPTHMYILLTTARWIILLIINFFDQNVINMLTYLMHFEHSPAYDFVNFFTPMTLDSTF